MGLFGERKKDQKQLPETVIVEPVAHYPICPHCELEIKKVYEHKIYGENRATLGLSSSSWAFRIFSCGNCNKVIPVIAGI